MRLSLILSSLFFATSLSAVNYTGGSSTSSNGVLMPQYNNNLNTCDGGDSQIFSVNSTPPYRRVFTSGGVTSTTSGYKVCASITTYILSSTTSCPVNTVADSQGQCVKTCSSGTTFSYPTNTCVAPPLSSYNGNQSGCATAGGIYFKDGTCQSTSGAISKIFTDPTAVLGGFVFINGLAWTSAGLLALPFTGGASGAIISYGGHAMAAGLGTMLYSANSQLASSVDVQTPSSDFTSSGNRVKVNLDQYQSSTIVKADTTTGKVTQISNIPPEVRQRIIDGVVNPTTGLPNLTQADLKGTTSTSYDYSTNTATTQTVKSDGTTATTTTTFTPITNTDGTVTAQSKNEAVAPTVTGTKTSTADAPNWSPYQTLATWTTQNASTAGTTTTSTPTGSTTVATGDTTADALINAKMPSYTLNGGGNINNPDETAITAMSTSTNDFIGNIQGQITSARTVYDQTQSLLTTGLTPPAFPQGGCGNGMSLDIYGKHVDLCAPIVSFTSPYAPLIALLVTLLMVALAIKIFLGGL